MNKKIPRLSRTAKRLLNRYKERLIDIDQKAGKFTPEISAIVDHVDALIEREKESK